MPTKNMLAGIALVMLTSCGIDGPPIRPTALVPMETNTESIRARAEIEIEMSVSRGPFPLEPGR